MKRCLSLWLAVALAFCGMNAGAAETFPLSERVLSGQEMLAYVEDAVYSELADILDSEQFFVESVATSYVST